MRALRRATTTFSGPRIALTCAAATTVLAGSASSALAAGPGSADTAFAGGSASLPANTRLFATATQSNGDVVAVGESGIGTSPNVLVARFTPTGRLDTSFGSGGIASGPAVSGAPGSIARAVAIQPDGKIVVAGDATDKTGTARDGLLVERFNTNGTPDSSFGSGGAANELAGSEGQGNAVAIQPGGDIVAGGSAASGGPSFAAVVRLTPNGGLDSGFAGHGADVIDLGAYSVVQALAIQGNGAIVLAGSQSPGLQAVNALIARLSPSGALDGSFAGTGAVAKQYAPAGGAYSSFNGLVIQKDGKIVAVGNATGSGETAETFAVRFTTSGAQDGGFGSGGVATAPAARQWIQQGNIVPGALAATLAANGDIIAAGDYANSVLTYGTLWAFTPAGQLDSSFGSSGIALFTPSSGANSEFTGAALSPTTGNIAAVGDTSFVGGSNYAGLAASFIGYGKPSGGGGGGAPALKLSVAKLKANDKAGTLSLAAGCNTACTLSATLGANAQAARALKITTRVRQCRKVHGKRTCKTVRVYRFVRLASVRTKLSGAGTRTLTLRLSKGVTRQLHRLKSVTLSVTVTASAGGKTVKFTKNVKFVR